MNMKRGKIILILILMSISISILVYSFAYTTTTHTGDDSSYLMISEIVFGLNDAVESINLEQQTPTIDKFGLLNKSFSFSITNTSSTDLPYTVRLIDKDIISTIPNDQIRYQLTVNGNKQEIQNLVGGGAIDSGSIAKGDTIEYSLIVWLDYNATSTGGVWEKVASVKAGTDNLDGSGANPPILLDNMIPVYYDAKEDVWRKADRTNSNSNHKWYDYDDRMWANAVTIGDGIFLETSSESQTINTHELSLYKFESGNYNIGGSTSQMTLTVSSPNSDGNFSFDYSVSSESNYDKLTITVDGTTVVSGISGESNGTYTVNLIAGKEHEIVAKYVKDSNTDGGNDESVISNLVSSVNVVVNFSTNENYSWKSIKDSGVNARDIYIDANVGEPILMNDISSFYVWIPRFKYDLFESGSPKIINVTFEHGLKNTGTMKCKITAGTEVCTGETTSYTHPAFTFGDEELTGYWINKFELSPEPSTTCYSNVNSTNCNISDLVIVSKPNLNSLRYISIGNLFYSVRNMELNNNIYGFENGGTTLNGDGSIDGDNNNYDIHLARNFEFAALAYLTYSNYGKYSNPLFEDATHKLLFNNYSRDKTGSSYVDGKTYDYNVEYYGTGASTTGNMYGVYDLNGSVSEYVMANVIDINKEFYQYSETTSQFTDAPLSKYYDIYKNTYGSGIGEFSGFSSNSSNTPSSYNPFIARKSVESVYISNGETALNYGGRAVITVNDIYITKW